ncbi:MAG: NIPSNAP family protein [Pigmentiphaga sp.]|nr:NIPSNAP family protein [Pigmentiphaga sp.]
MILELRFDQLRPRQVPSYTERWRAALPQRQALSPLMGLWRTEVGDIDQIVHLWAYDDMAQRDRVEGEAAALPEWNDLQCRAQVQRQSNLLVAPAPFSPALAERALGTIYELRIYQYDAGTIPNVIERWQEKIEARQRLSPLVLCGHTISGTRHQWVHMWAYHDALERMQIRAEALRSGAWPPAATDGLVHQRNMLLTPLPPSPLA